MWHDRMWRTTICVAVLSAAVCAARSSGYDGVRLFMVKAGEEQIAPTTGPTQLVTTSGETVTIEVWLEDGAQIDLLSAYQFTIPWEATLISGEGSAKYVNRDPPGAIWGNSIRVDVDRTDFVLHGNQGIGPLFLEDEDKGFINVVMTARFVPCTPVYVEGLRYLGSFQIETQTVDCAEFELAFMEDPPGPGTDVTGSDCLSLFEIDEYQPLRIVSCEACGSVAACEEGVFCTIDSCDVETGLCEHIPDDSLCDNWIDCDGIERCNPELGCVSGPAMCGGVTTCSDECAAYCPQPCSWHGMCVDGVCVCDVGWDGDNCSIALCPNDCLEKGICLNGVCACEAGWSGPDCGRAVSSDRRLFMARAGYAHLTPTSGPTEIRMHSGEKATIEIWAEDGNQVDGISGCTYELPWTAELVSGSGTVAYVDNNTDEGNSDSQRINIHRPDFVFFGVVWQGPYYFEREGESFGGGVTAPILPCSPVPLPGMRYIGEFQLHADGQDGSEFELVFLDPGGNTAAFNGSCIGTYAFNHYQPLRILVTDECNDGVECTVDVFDEGTQQCVNAPDDAFCDNGFACDGVVVCDPYFGCVPGVPPCDDGVACTQDICNGSLDECENVPDDGFCDNGVVCDGVEWCDPLLGCQTSEPQDCDNGVFCDGVEFCDPELGCVSPGLNCDDGFACTKDWCDEANDRCQHLPNDAMCDNGMTCDGSEWCDPASGCVVIPPPECDDGFMCTVDSCFDGTDECAHTPKDSLCDDGVFCNGYERCDVESGCVPGEPRCPDQFCNEESKQCVNCFSHESCNDGEFCNGAEQCVDGACMDGSSPCGDQLCDENADACVECLSNGDCDDGAFCDGTEWCVGGNCEAGEPPCGDKLCHEEIDACVECVTDEDCDNGVFCDGVERCTAGFQCRAGVPVFCDDGVECTIDVCDEFGRVCVHVDSGCVPESDSSATQDEGRGDGPLETGTASGIDIGIVDDEEPPGEVDAAAESTAGRRNNICGIFGGMVIVPFVVGIVTLRRMGGW